MKPGTEDKQTEQRTDQKNDHLDRERKIDQGQHRSGTPRPDTKEEEDKSGSSQFHDKEADSQKKPDQYR
jgi:hypothetical protein